MSSFYFAWCGPGETFGPSHQVYDENVFGFSVEGKEGEICTATITLRNPRIGLLNPGRSLWAFLSYYDGGTAATPIFYGRLVGIPSNIFAEQVDLVFVARPLDYGSRRHALANDMAILPAYDPLFIDPNLRITADGGDPDVVLEGYPSRWHVDRITHELTASDIINGEDGTEAFTAGSDGVAYEGMGLTFDPPLLSVTVKAQVDWTQTAAGPIIDLGSLSIPTYTQSLQSDWPKPGQSLGGGWQAAPGTVAADVYGVEFLNAVTTNIHWENKAKQHVTGDAMSLTVNRTEAPCRGPYIKQVLTETIQPGVIDTGFQYANGGTGPLPAAYASDTGDIVNIPMHYSSTGVVIPQSLIVTQLNVQYETGRKRTEHIEFTVSSDVQAVLTQPGEFDTGGGGSPSDRELMEINGADVTVPIEGVAPLTDPQAGSYWATDRGLQSLEYCLLRARARLLAGARIAKLSWSCSFDRALALTCRKNASLTERRLPGGSAYGKIIAYTISADGSSGKLGGQVTIGCSVGHDGTISPVAGTPEIWETDFVETDFQQYDGVVAVIGSDLGYTPPVSGDNAMIPLTRADILISQTVHGSVSAQAALIRSKAATWFKSGDELDPILANAPWWVQQWMAASNAQTDTKQLIAAKEAAQKAQEELDANAIWVETKLKPVDQLALEDAHQIAVTQLKVPKTIDLEAASVG